MVKTVTLQQELPHLFHQDIEVLTLVKKFTLSCRLNQISFEIFFHDSDVFINDNFQDSSSQNVKNFAGELAKSPREKTKGQQIYKYFPYGH